MVKLHVYLLAIALATGSALASSNKFQRREFDNQVQSSGSHSHHCSTTLGGFGDEPDEDTFDDLEAREPGLPVPGLPGVALKVATMAFKLVKHHAGSISNVGMAASTMIPAGSTGSSNPSSSGSGGSNKHRRELEDNEGPFERDLNVEELFGRESYPLDERDVIDNGDLFVRDFGTEELYGREYDLLDERDITDDKDLFVRDLFFGREYD